MTYVTQCYCDICEKEIDEPKQISIYIDGKVFREIQLCKPDYDFVFDLILGLSDKINLEKTKRGKDEKREMQKM